MPEAGFRRRCCVQANRDPTQPLPSWAPTGHREARADVTVTSQHPDPVMSLRVPGGTRRVGRGPRRREDRLRAPGLRGGHQWVARAEKAALHQRRLTLRGERAGSPAGEMEEGRDAVGVA